MANMAKLTGRSRTLNGRLPIACSPTPRDYKMLSGKNFRKFFLKRPPDLAATAYSIEKVNSENKMSSTKASLIMRPTRNRMMRRSRSSCGS